MDVALVEMERKPWFRDGNLLDEVLPELPSTELRPDHVPCSVESPYFSG